MSSFIRKYHRLLFYGTWLILGLVQAGFTELFDDEGYYWVYSRFLDWGYFDHPPMIAVMIKIGYGLFHNEFGLRLLVVLMSTATIYIVQQLLDRKNDFLFYAIAGSLAAAQIGGFIAVPDIPLMFFVAVFFFYYRRFTGYTHWWNTLLLAISITLMMYSKYHGVLIVLFTLLSNPGLFRQKQTYVVMLLSLVFYFPHLYWQYNHDFASVYYHLFERNKAHYEISYSLEYLLGQVLLAGPFLGWLFLWGAFRYKTTNLTERALRYSMIGFYAFFLLSSLKAPVEANWTLPALVPLMVLSHQWLTNHRSWQRWVYRLLPLSLALVLFGRVYLIYDFLPSVELKKDEFHRNLANARAVSSYAKGKPVVILESAQGASKQWFYSGNPSFCLNHASYRRNNFNFWPLEFDLIGREVYAIGPDSSYFTQPVKAPRFSDRAGAVIDNYYSFSAIEFQHVRQVNNKQGSLAFTCTARVPLSYLPVFLYAPYDTASIWIATYNDKGKADRLLRTNYRVNYLVNRKQDLELKIADKIPPGRYRGKLVVSSCIPGYPSLNSSGFEINVEQ